MRHSTCLQVPSTSPGIEVGGFGSVPVDAYLTNRPTDRPTDAMENRLPKKNWRSLLRQKSLFAEISRRYVAIFQDFQDQRREGRGAVSMGPTFNTGTWKCSWGSVGNEVV